MAVVVGIGEILWDVYGRKKHLGGAPANFAFHAKELGDEGIPVSRIGDDSLGTELLERLRRLGVPTGHIQIDHRMPTGMVNVIESGTHPRYEITRNVAWDNLRSTAALSRLARRADAVCFGTLAQRNATARRTILKFLAAASRALIVCDLNLRAEFLDIGAVRSEQTDVVVNSIGASDVLRVNHAELQTLKTAFAREGGDDPFVRWLLREFQLRLVCVTLGGDGCLLQTPRRRVRSAGVKVNVVDTVGSGDAFTAAVVHGLVRRRPLQDVADFANQVGAYVASQPGATPALRGRF